MRIAWLLLAAIALTAFAGCGDANDGSGYGSHPATAPAGGSAQSCAAAAGGVDQLRVTGVECEAGREIVAAWLREPSCTAPASASRTSCGIDEYRCLGTTTDSGLAVSCAAPDRSISFLALRG